MCVCVAVYPCVRVFVGVYCYKRRHLFMFLGEICVFVYAQAMYLCGSACVSVRMSGKFLELTLTQQIPMCV